MRLRKRYLWLVALSAFVLTMAPSIASSEPLPVEAINEPVVGPYPEKHHWSNVPQTVIAGEKVTFSNPTEVPHGVEWCSVLKATCEEGSGKVPVGTTPAASGAKWSGKCTFSQAGTYTFYCTVHGLEMSGTITVTTPGAPTVTTGAASAVGETEATLEGTVNPQGKATTYRFKYGTTASYGSETSEQSAGEGSVDQSVSVPVTGLTAGTTYHFQLVAKNASGTTSGLDRTFTTPSPPGPPVATTGAATSVTENEATLKGTVNPDGKPTKYFFEWGTTIGYGQMTAEVPAGEDHANHAASATLTALAAATPYHFRLVAKNGSEEVQGADQVFTTQSPPPPPPPPPPLPPTPTTTTTTPTPTVQLVEPPPEPPLAGGPSLRSSQHGASVHGSVDVSRLGAGGRLEVDLLAKSASLAAARRSSPVRVGRFVRASVPAGQVSFSVGLSARAKSALRRHHRLTLTVRIVLTPTHGATVTIRRSVSLRA